MLLTRALSTAALVVTIALFWEGGSGGVFAFAPVTRPHETMVSPTCVVCAFVMDELQRTLPIEVEVAIRALQPTATTANDPISAHSALMQRLAAAINQSFTQMIADGFAYNVDQHHIRIAPPNAAATEAAEDDFENELPAVIKARRDRRVAAGLKPNASPWLLGALPDFYATYLQSRLLHYMDPDNPHDDARTPSNVSGATVLEAKIASQAQEDGPHDADLVRMVAAALDTIRLNRIQPPHHFLARFGCVVELHLCPETSDDTAPADDAEELLEATGESPEVSFRAVHQEPIHHHDGDEHGGHSSGDSAFMDAFLDRIAQATYHTEAARRVQRTTLAERTEAKGGVDSVLHPEDEAELHRGDAAALGHSDGADTQLPAEAPVDAAVEETDGVVFYDDPNQATTDEM